MYVTKLNYNKENNLTYITVILVPIFPFKLLIYLYVHLFTLFFPLLRIIIFLNLISYETLMSSILHIFHPV